MVCRGLIFLHLSIFTFSFAGAQQQNAPEYLDLLARKYQNIKIDTWSYIKATAHGRAAKKVEKRRKELLETIRNSTYAIRSMKPFEGDPSLRDAAVTYLDLSYKIINEDYADIVDLEVISEESYSAMEAYINAKKAAREKLSGAYNVLDHAQRVFASRHLIPVAEDSDKTSEKLVMAAEVFDYYQEMYLIFFRSYKSELDALNAINHFDHQSFEQSRKALFSFAMQGIDDFNKLGDFKSDPMLREAGLEMMNFYKDESETYFKKIANFITVKNEMDQMSRKMEKIPASKRTKEDVSRYNLVVREYNNHISDYKEINSSLTSDRIVLLEKWNNVVDAFLSKHVPK